MVTGRFSAGWLLTEETKWGGGIQGGGRVMLQEAAEPSRDTAELLINLMDKLSFFSASCWVLTLRGRELQSPEISHEAPVTRLPRKHGTAHPDPLIKTSGVSWARRRQVRTFKVTSAPSLTMTFRSELCSSSSTETRAHLAHALLRLCGVVWTTGRKRSSFTVTEFADSVLSSLVF